METSGFTASFFRENRRDRSLLGVQHDAIVRLIHLALDRRVVSRVSIAIKPILRNRPAGIDALLGFCDLPLEDTLRIGLGTGRNFVTDAVHLAIGVGAGLDQFGLLGLRGAHHFWTLRALGGRRRSKKKERSKRTGGTQN